MAGCDSSNWFGLLSLSSLLLLLVLGATTLMQQFVVVLGQSQVPCFMIFGDSLSDGGNNNPLPTTQKTNYNPYGIDFPTGPSGRFTDGLTNVDILGQLLGFASFIPPVLNTTGSDILKGVNYASGSAGIRVESGKHLGDNLDLGKQVTLHKAIVSKIARKLGGFEKAQKYLKKCLYYVNIGSNDYINNYFLPEIYPTSRLYTLDQYAQVLIDQLSKYLQALHGVGARKYALVGLGNIGCTPNAISKNGTNGTCVQEQNSGALMFSVKLKLLVDQLNTDQFSADSKFIFINSTAGTIDSSLVANASCCPLKNDGLCVDDEAPCPNRNDYVFWDGFHPTSAINKLIARVSYNAPDPMFAYPTDIKTLVQS